MLLDLQSSTAIPYHLPRRDYRLWLTSGSDFRNLVGMQMLIPLRNDKLTDDTLNPHPWLQIGWAWVPLCLARGDGFVTRHTITERLWFQNRSAFWWNSWINICHQKIVLFHRLLHKWATTQLSTVIGRWLPRRLSSAPVTCNFLRIVPLFAISSIWLVPSCARSCLRWMYEVLHRRAKKVEIVASASNNKATDFNNHPPDD